MVSAEVHLTVENAAPKKNNVSFLVSFRKIADCLNKNKLNVVPKKEYFQLVLSFTQTAEPQK